MTLNNETMTGPFVVHRQLSDDERVKLDCCIQQTSSWLTSISKQYPYKTLYPH